MNAFAKTATSSAAVFLSVLLSISAAMSNEDVRAINNPAYAIFQTNGDVFVLMDTLQYKIESTGKIIEIPKGFVTDFASVPPAARSFVSVLGKYSIPAVVHDYLYWDQRCTRDEADAILAEAMKEYKASWLQINSVYYGVQWRGQKAWTDNNSERKAGLPRVLPVGSGGLPANLDWTEYRKALFDQGVRAEPFAQGATPPAYCKLKNE